MIHIAFTEDLGFTGNTILISHFLNWHDFAIWLNRNDPKELYVSESTDEILKFVEQLIYCDTNPSFLEER